MTDGELDLKAASRISRRVDLRDIRLTELHATCTPPSATRSALVPEYDHECVPGKAEGGTIEVLCSFNFKVSSADTEVADAKIKYRVLYGLVGDEPADPSDIVHFARANGAYHTWPFVRETIYSLTSRMGFPPYTLPVLSFLPKPKPKAEGADVKDTEPASTE